MNSSSKLTDSVVVLVFWSIPIVELLASDVVLFLYAEGLLADQDLYRGVNRVPRRLVYKSYNNRQLIPQSGIRKIETFLPGTESTAHG